MTADDNGGWVIVNEENMLMYDLAYRLGLPHEVLVILVEAASESGSVLYANVRTLETMERQS